MNIVITGATGGIGEKLVEYFCKDFNNKIVAIGRDKTKLTNLSNSLHAKYQGCQVIFITSDFSKSDFEGFDVIKNYLPHVDVLINNAGMMLKKPFHSITQSEIQLLYQINVFTPFFLIQKLSVLMGKINKSHVVNISSMGGFQGSVKFPDLSVYASSKAALANLTELLAVELSDKNIALNCLALGAVDTDMLHVAFPTYKAPVNAEEMAEFIGWFSIYGHRFFNGKVIPVSLSTP